VPSLFYSPFWLNNKRIRGASPFMAGIHQVNRQILSHTLRIELDLDGEVSVDFLPVLTQLMATENVITEEICAGCAVRLFPKITLAKCQELRLPYITPTGREPNDEFLLASHAKAIPVEHQQHMLRFLIRMTEVKGRRAVLAVAILLHGFWVRLKNSSTSSICT
jgi:hypothetical protein